MPCVYGRISSQFKFPKIIHIIGTNGKGTTGRFLATALYKKGYRVGHYTSPHILQFNERVWFNGSDVAMECLESTHKKLLALLTQDEAESLSYFEYTTLLAMLYYSDKSDFVVLEAGLGGEHDATAVFANDLTLVTPIAMDHEAFLGSDIESIAKTKLNAAQKAVIIAKQRYKVVYDIMNELQKEKGLQTFRVEELLDEKDRQNILKIAEHEILATYLQTNLALAIAALKYFKIEYSVEDFYNAKLFGRLSVLEKNIIVDVGHNVLAAESISESLKNNKYTLVYNSYKDKNYKEILSVLKPIIETVELIDVYNARVEESGYLQQTLEDLGINYSKFKKLETEKKYLVFGSFSVVEAFLKVYRG
ncbi:bifunctional folylpolyglutamate synthase/dihydrofolate synthase [Sulfurimonas paralvinellae]|uniref:Bifunctional folylpolyglutamate synthase/dihydrofolate synthase n=2 Tax=Sulfurimonas paralvinellae TaxID=317658 RepID=A0A7M1BAE5_9BACT|nr:bifunctional folylpolyglutamate synthase/dihydrofolate synthase [Sulfurimonas paralvinellae]